jgi:hypothetical protein
MCRGIRGLARFLWGIDVIHFAQKIQYSIIDVGGCRDDLSQELSIRGGITA